MHVVGLARRWKRRSGGRLLLAMLLPGLVAGCDRDRLSQFETFAAAGTLYVAAFHGLVAEIGEATVANDSATLMAARTMAGSAVAANAATYSGEIVTEDKLLRQYLVNLDRLDRHARLLGEYFGAITTVANGKAAEKTVANADGLLDALAGLNAEVAKSKIGDRAVKDFLGPATTEVVGHFEVRALERGLRRAAPVVDEALALQEAAALALAAQLRRTEQSSLEMEEQAAVIRPYVAAGPLPQDWAERRAAYVRASVATDDAGHAVSAIQALRRAFRALVANEGKMVDLQELLQAVNALSGDRAAGLAGVAKQ